MAVKVKVSDIVASREALQELVQMKLGVKASYWLQKIVRKVVPEIEDFEAARLKLVEKYQAPDAPGQVTPENMTAFRSEIQEVLDEELVLEIKQVPLSLLQNVEVQVSTIMALDFLFFDDTSPNGAFEKA